MRPIRIFFTALVTVVSAHSGLSQTTFPEAFEYLDVNNIEAGFGSSGAFFWNGSFGEYRVPKAGSVGTMFAGGLWIGGIDAPGQLKLAAQTYRSGRDYWPGPLDINASTDSLIMENWNKIWKVSKAQINRHIADFNDNGVIDFPQAAIYDWPAKGNIFATGKGGVPLLITQDAAPFFDMNLDGFYTPNNGDYPDIKGDEMLWYVFNDRGGLHTETGAVPIGIEVQISAYGYNCPTDDVLYNTLFVNYKVINKAPTTPLYDVYVGKWIDFDLGCHDNDYIGCDTISNTFYAYNGFSNDPDCATQGYGNNPPIQTVTFLDNQMSSFVYYNNDFSATGNPETALHYYNYLTAKWKDGSPIETDQCTGVATGTPGKYMFPGNPIDSNSVSDCACNNPPADRRGLGAIGPFTFAPGQTIDMTLAYSTHFLPYTLCPDFTAYRQRIDSIQHKFDNNLLQSCTQSNLTCSDTVLGCVWPGDANADGIADVWDVLPIGISFGTTGTTRPNATTTWTGQPMQDWTQNFMYIGQNYKHADCDGSGIIDVSDFQPILDNYGLVHFKQSESGKTGIPLYLDFPAGFHPAGSTVSVPVILGNSSAQVSNFYAIAFSVAYNNSVVQPGSVNANFDSTWIGTSGQDLAGIFKELSPAGRVDIGITRTDHITRAGFGKIATINYILIDDIAGKGSPAQVLGAEITEAYAISNDETEIELQIISGLRETALNQQVKVYPVPADEQLVVEFQSTENFTVELIDVAGKRLYESTSMRNNRILIETKSFSSGIYFLRIRSRNGSLTEKVIITTR